MLARFCERIKGIFGVIDCSIDFGVLGAIRLISGCKRMMATPGGAASPDFRFTKFLPFRRCDWCRSPQELCGSLICATGKNLV